MSKAVLVMNMPKNCMKCPIGKNMNNAMEVCIKCPFGRCAIDEEAKTIPSWCPLREIPSKYADKDFTPIKDERYDNGYEDGYNACIDDILEDS